MRIRSLTAATAVAAAAFVALAAAAPAETSRAADPRITPKRVGKVRLGMTAAELRARGLIGRLKPACELEGPDARFAPLKGPVRGTVEFTQTTPRRAQFVHVRNRRARARGVRVGDRLADITAAFPKRKVIPTPFGVTRVKIPKRGGGRMDFVIRDATNRIAQISIPRMKVCD